MWDLPGAEIEPVSPPLASRLLTTGPTGKSLVQFLDGKHSSSMSIFRKDQVKSDFPLNVSVLTDLGALEALWLLDERIHTCGAYGGI